VKTHPYKELKGTRTWKVVNRAINALVVNQDLVEKTPREYIVGYLTKKLSDEGLTSERKKRGTVRTKK